MVKDPHLQASLDDLKRLEATEETKSYQLLFSNFLYPQQTLLDVRLLKYLNGYIKLNKGENIMGKSIKKTIICYQFKSRLILTALSGLIDFCDLGYGENMYSQKKKLFFFLFFNHLTEEHHNYRILQVHSCLS